MLKATKFEALVHLDLVLWDSYTDLLVKCEKLGWKDFLMYL